MREKPRSIKIFELSFVIIEKILKNRQFRDKEELLLVMQNAVNIAKKDDAVADYMKEAYQRAYNKIDAMTWEEISDYQKMIIAEDK